MKKLGFGFMRLPKLENGQVDLEHTQKMVDAYMDAARECAAAHGVPVCDAYALWRRLQQDGVDITLLLANYINHPLPEMHDLFARLLLKTLLGEESKGHIGRAEDGMTDAARQ